MHKLSNIGTPLSYWYFFNLNDDYEKSKYISESSELKKILQISTFDHPIQRRKGIVRLASHYPFNLDKWSERKDSSFRLPPNKHYLQSLQWIHHLYAHTITCGSQQSCHIHFGVFVFLVVGQRLHHFWCKKLLTSTIQKMTLDLFI